MRTSFSLRECAAVGFIVLTLLVLLFPALRIARERAARQQLRRTFVRLPRTWDAAMLVSRCFNTAMQPTTIDGVDLGPGDWRSMTTAADITRNDGRPASKEE
jgi:hypothetical protein